MSRALPSSVDKPRYVADMFGRIAPRYDLMNTLMTVGQDASWRRVVADSVAGARRVLDVGTGTGKLASAIQARARAPRVVGVDFSEPMLRHAPSGLPRAAADALRLPFADACFDAVISAFLVRNLADLDAGVTEQVRVLAPGGQLVVLETTPGPRGAMRPLFQAYFRGLVPRLGRLIASDASAYTYLPESTAAFVEPEHLAQVLRAHGLLGVSTQHLGFGTIGITTGRKPGILPG